MDKKNIAVLFGGKSSEHDVSCISASFVIENIDTDIFNVFMIGINKSGEWYLFCGDISEIKNKTWQNNINNKRALISPDTSSKGLVVFDENNEFSSIKIDAVFPVLHGKNGEDGSIQGLLQLANIPFVGCDMNSSAVCMDKITSNIIFKHEGINEASFTWVYGYEIEQDIDKCTDKCEKAIASYPMFVKPSSAGSSVGVSKAKNREELKQALIKAKKEDQKILIEQAIDGIEVECAVLGNKNKLEASTIGQIAPANEFYDYEAKYSSDESELYIPAKLSSNMIEKIRRTAKDAYQVTGCSGLARVDFFVDKGNNIYLNEINTLPGFTSISMYPKLMENYGYKAKELITKLIELSFER